MPTAVDTYSYVNMILLACLAGMFTVIVGVAGWWASDMSRKLSRLDELANQHSEGMVKFQSWADGHDKQDDDRHEENTKRLDRNQDSIHDVRNALSVLGLKEKLRQREEAERNA